MTYREAVRLLESCGVEDAAYDAAELFSFFVGVSRAELLAKGERDFDSEALSEAVKKRCERVPLQYILGEWEFFGLTLEVGPDCLCPRGDTEITVEETLKRLPRGARVLELCTGSGCIPIALCATRGDITAVSTDAFENTLALAKRNADKNGVGDRITFLLSDIFARELPYNDFDAIVSNPPYIPTADVGGLSPEVSREPRAALDGGADGLDFYREILGYYTRYLKPHGFVALEIGYDQGDAVSALARENGLDCEIIKDLGGNDRCAVCRMK